MLLSVISTTSVLGERDSEVIIAVDSGKLNMLEDGIEHCKSGGKLTSCICELDKPDDWVR